MVIEGERERDWAGESVTLTSESRAGSRGVMRGMSTPPEILGSKAAKPGLAPQNA